MCIMREWKEDNVDEFTVLGFFFSRAYFNVSIAIFSCT